MTERLRADQVGSLLRPAALLQAREGHGQGRLSAEALREEEDRAILTALEGQRRVGLEIFSDGEFRRGSWLTDMAAATGGFVPQSRVVEWHGPGGGEEASTSQVVGAKLQPRRRLTGDQLPFLKANAPGRIKMTVPAPSNFYVVSWRQGVSDGVYPSREDMVPDLVAIIRQEVEKLIAEGVTYVQLDAPFYCVFLDESVRAGLRQAGLDLEDALEQMVAADSACVEGLAREGLTLALHICRGNSRSRWMAEGAFDPIAEQLLGRAAFDTFLLEYDQVHHGGFEPLRFLPAGKTAVLGLVTTKQPRLETKEELARRIGEAARFAPLDQLTLSPQCGFASVATGNLISEDDQWRKLELVVETARSVWT